jgi:hypothetical protein
MTKLADLRYRIFAADEHDRFVDVILEANSSPRKPPRKP